MGYGTRASGKKGDKDIPHKEGNDEEFWKEEAKTYMGAGCKAQLYEPGRSTSAIPYQRMQ